MPAKLTRQRKQKEEHTYIALRVERYEAHVGASVNHYAYAPQYAWDLDESDPLYKFTSQLTITGRSIYPDERAGETYELTVYGE